jgi:hypothetical protein
MYKKSVDKYSNKAMYNYIHDHFRYDILNSWNRLKSVANNVKVYNLPVDYNKAMNALDKKGYGLIDDTIINWIEEHPSCKVFFNGRSGGYLVLTSSYRYSHPFDELSPIEYSSYEDWKADIKEGYGFLKNYRSILLEDVQLLQDFDKLCDDLIEVLKEMIADVEDEEARTFEWHAIKKCEQYTYESLEDMKHHKEYMLQHGYKVFDEDEEYLYIDYECCDEEEGTVVYSE